MSWDVTHQYVEKQTGYHVIHLQDAWSKARHILQIMIGKDHCPMCGHVHPKTNTGELDMRALIATEIAALETVHSNIDAHAKKWGVAVRQPK